MALSEFNIIKHCNSCNGWNRATKNTFAFVKQLFEVYNCILTSTEYNRTKDKLEFICSCGRPGKATFNDFINSKHKKCRDCTNELCIRDRRHSYDDVSANFTKKGCILISPEYKSNRIPLDYICKCGEISKISYSHFLDGTQCKRCGLDALRAIFQYSYDQVQQYFKDNGCSLLTTEYINNKQPLEYICVCKNKSVVRFDSFIQGHRCGCIKSKGEINVIHTLVKLKLDFKRQQTYPDCVNVKCLRFDFYVYHGFMIEFDGIQHFKSIRIFGGDTKYIIRVQNDHIKNKYCLDNNLPLLRISYMEFDSIDKIINDYIALFEKNSIPPIMFSNKILYHSMKTKITDELCDNWFMKT